MLGTDYPLLDFFWSVFIFFGFFIWIWLLVTIFTDLFRSHDLSGVAKAAWFVLVLLVPLLGALIYLIARGHKMQEHAAQAAEEQDTAFREYVQSAATDGSTASQLTKLAELRDRGVISEEEFSQQKVKLLR
jgi:hypothetical protein